MDLKDLNTSQDGVYPAIAVVKKDPQLAAAVSKLEKPHMRNTAYDQQGNRTTDINTLNISSILSKRAKRNSDSAAIVKLLPDIALSKQILVSCVLSPKDMTSTELTFKGPKGIFSPELSSSIISRIQRHFEEEYKIKEKLSIILEEALFEKGAYPVAVIPENTIDDFINGNRAISTENFNEVIGKHLNKNEFKNIGLLGDPNKPTVNKNILSLEGFNKPLDYSGISQKVNAVIDGTTIVLEDLKILDNPSVLKMPALSKAVTSKTVLQQYSKHSLAIESLNDIGVDRLLFRTRNHASQMISSLAGSNEVTRKSVGNPLIMKLPSESILPIHVPGNVREHVGYFILLDQEGNPIESPDGDHDYSALSNSKDSFSSTMIKKIESNIGSGGCFDPNNQSHTAMATNLYAEVIEKDLINRVKNGVYNSNIKLGKNEEVYRIMLSRVLSKKMTQILFLPAEYVTYIAFKYGDDGIGRSLLDDTMTINTLRTVMMFTDMMGSMKNAIGRTKVSAQLPEHDPNPMKTIEKIVDDVVRSRTVQMPMGVNNPNDIFEFVQRSGYEWEFTGHPGIPELKLAFDQVQSNYQKVDSDLQDNLRKASISALGLTPELVDSGFQTEFATTAIANNILLSKRVINIQEMFTPQLSDHMRKVSFNSQFLLDDLKKLVSENIPGIKTKLEEIVEGDISTLSQEIKNKILVTKTLEDFLNGFHVELPKPNSVTLEQQLQDLQVYTDGLDKALEAFIAPEYFNTNTVGDVANDLDSLKSMIKSHYIRRWLSERGVMSELSELVNIGEDGKPLFDLESIAKQHMEALSNSGISTLNTLKKIAERNNEKITPNPDGTDTTAPPENTGDEGVGADGNPGLDPDGLDDGLE